MKVTGTTTIAKDAAARLIERKNLPDRTPLHIDGLLQREPDNPVDPFAVAVHVEGERIGYLPSYVAKALRLDPGAGLPCPVQTFCASTAKGPRVEAWAWIAEGPSRWQFSQTNAPPLTTAEKRAEERDAIDDMVNEAVAGSDERARQFKAAQVKGIHYLQVIEPFKQMKRESSASTSSRVPNPSAAPVRPLTEVDRRRCHHRRSRYAASR